jgi:hypothetical protein
MTIEERKEELRKVRAFLDERSPDWREAVGADGRPIEFVRLCVTLKDGSVLDLVLFSRPEPVTGDPVDPEAM